MFMRLYVTVLICASFCLGQNSDWDEPFPPHRIADNLYYVGSRGLSTYLITTSKGHILINSSFDRTVPIIKANVEKLGFKFSDIKILLASHAHDDHVAGHAMIQKMTGAKVYVMRGDDDVVASGGKGMYLYKSRWTPVKVDRILEDGEEVQLGEATLKARLTPGHTRGCTTWTMEASDKGRKLAVIIIGSPNVNPGFQLVKNRDYPGIASDYARAFEVWRSLPCDIYLGAHGNYYGMEEKVKLLGTSETNPFIDPKGYKEYIRDREQNYRKILMEQSK